MSTPYPPADSGRDFHGVLRDRGQVVIPPTPPPRRIGGRAELAEHAALLREQLTALAAAETAHLLMLAEQNEQLAALREQMSYAESEMRLTRQTGRWLREEAVWVAQQRADIAAAASLHDNPVSVAEHQARLEVLTSYAAEIADGAHIHDTCGAPLVWTWLDDVTAAHRDALDTARREHDAVQTTDGALARVDQLAVVVDHLADGHRVIIDDPARRGEPAARDALPEHRIDQPETISSRHADPVAFLPYTGAEATLHEHRATPAVEITHHRGMSL